MVRPAVRTTLCLLVGVFAGVILGPLFVPDPVSGIAGALTVVVSVLVATVLYRSDWLGGRRTNPS